MIASNKIRLAAAVAPVLALLLLVGCKSSTPPKVEASAGEPEAQVPAGAQLLKGAGSTFDAPIFNRWFMLYRQAHPDTYIKYAAVGSGEGIQRFIGNNVDEKDRVDFGASDAAMNDSQIAQANSDVLMVPVTAGCVVLAYNVPGLNAELRLSRKAYVGIFLGEITNWNDPIIAAANPGVKLPNLTIVTAVRQEGSGTTYAFTRNLDAISDQWRAKYGPGTLINWPGNAMRAKGNEGVAGLVEKSIGSIGYMEYGFARRLGLDYATLENKDGKYVKASEQSCSAALANAEMPENLRLFVPDPSGPDSYPIATFSWVLLRRSYPDAKTADALKGLFQWSLQDGQRYAGELGYVPLPQSVAQKALAAVNSISSGGS